MIRILFVTMSLLLVRSIAFGQFFIGAQGSYLASSEYSNAGLGLQGKMMVNDNLAIGIQYRNFPYKSTDDYGSNGFSVANRNRVTSLSGMAEYYFGDRVHDPYTGPYVGIDIGYFNNKVITNVSGDNIDLRIDHERPFLGVGPKFGVMVRPRSAISFFGQAQYTFAVGDREPDDITITQQQLEDYSVENKPLKNSLIFDLGALIAIGE